MGKPMELLFSQTFDGKGARHCLLFKLLSENIDERGVSITLDTVTSRRQAFCTV